MYAVMLLVARSVICCAGPKLKLLKETLDRRPINLSLLKCGDMPVKIDVQLKMWIPEVQVL